MQKHEICFPHLNGEQIKSFEMSCITIDQLFQKYKIKTLDWLLLDVEGIDSKLLLSTDWSKYDVKKIEFESLHLDDSKEEIKIMLKNFGYMRSKSLHKYDECWIKKEWS